MSGPKFTIHRGALPARSGGGSRRRGSRYDPYIDAAIEHEGDWIRLDAFATREARAAHSMATSVRGAAKRTQARLNFKGGFTTAARKVDGTYYVFLRKDPAA